MNQDVMDAQCLKNMQKKFFNQTENIPFSNTSR